MRHTQRALLICCLCLCTACSNAHLQTTPTISTLASIPTAATSSPTEVSNSKAVSASLLLRIPKCEGIEIQEKPIVFSWPNIETRIKELGDALWGYYICDQSQEDVVAFYRANMPEPPYNNQETNWVERAEGSVGIYYNSANAWLYIWIVPKTDDPEKTYVIVAISYVLISC
jgi:hypothetical protein